MRGPLGWADMRRGGAGPVPAEPVRERWCARAVRGGRLLCVSVYVVLVSFSVGPRSRPSALPSLPRHMYVQWCVGTPCVLRHWCWTCPLFMSVVVCSTGQCANVNGLARCTCTEGYIGPLCGTAVPPPDGTPDDSPAPTDPNPPAEPETNPQPRKPSRGCCLFLL